MTKLSIEFAPVRLSMDDFDRSGRLSRDILILRPGKGHGHSPHGEFERPVGAGISSFDRRLKAKAVGRVPGRASRRSRTTPKVRFETTDVDAFPACARRRRASIASGPQNRPGWGSRTADVREPDDRVIEVDSGLNP